MGSYRLTLLATAGAVMRGSDTARRDVGFPSSNQRPRLLNGKRLGTGRPRTSLVRLVKRNNVSRSCLAMSVTILSMFSSPAGATQPPWTSSRVHGSPEPPAPFRLEEAYPHLRFENTTCLDEAIGGGRIFVGELSGRVYSFSPNNDAMQADLVVDLSDMLSSSAEGQAVTATLFGMQLDPQFVTNRFIYLVYVFNGPDAHTRLSRLTLTDSAPYLAVTGSEEIILTWPTGGHNAGCLRFGNDGYLYVSTGDGVGPNPPDPKGNAQNLSNLFGCLLRIDVHSRDGQRGYSIPPDNPFVDRDDCLPEIWSYGFRNPWRFSVDRETGQVWVGDNGWETWELIHHAIAGSNHGWPIMEGRKSVLAHIVPGPTPIIPPVKMADPRILVPGEPFRSTLFYRLAKLGTGRMPYIGSTEVDGQAVLLVHDWIRSLKDDSETSQNTDDQSTIEMLSQAKNGEARRGDELAKRLLATTEGALLLSHRIHTGSLAPEIRDRAIQLSQESPTTDVRGLFEAFIPESLRRARLGPSFDPQEVLSLTGDVARGQLIFTSDTSRCRACHPVAGEGPSVGPDVKNLAKEYSVAELLRQIVQPSEKIDPKYFPHTLVTATGQIFTGLIVEQTDSPVTLRMADGKSVPVAADEIDELEKQDRSLMPEMLLADLTAQEAADLLAYLMSLR